MKNQTNELVNSSADSQRDQTRVLLAKLFETWRNCDSAYLKLVRQWGISLNTVWALEYISKHPEGVEPAVLADDTHMLRQTITVVLNDLEGRGYLTRGFHATDRRRKIIRLTPVGVTFARRVLDTISKAEIEASANLNQEEQEMLLALSTRFCSAFARHVDNICEGKAEE
jgi:DNA-binding MarR family transcriptional regulator